MKKIIIEVIKLLVVNVIVNLIFNILVYLLKLEISEFANYLICIVKSIGIVFIGVNVLWDDMDKETLKKVLIAFTVILVVYNIFDVVKDIAEYEESINQGVPMENIQFDDTLTNRERKELQEFLETLRAASENLREYLIENRDEYYALLLRAYVIINNLITIAIYCFVAPKWFELRNQKRQNNRTVDFYKE